MFIATDDATLYVASFGSAPRTLVAMGGWTGSWELWTDPFAILSQNWRTVAYDHRGCGATIAPVESITFPTLVSDVFAVLDALGIERCVLAAESSGAAVALQAALEQPHRFQGLVLVDGVYQRPMSDGPAPFVRALRADYAGTLAGFVNACLPEPNSEPLRRWGRMILDRASQAAAIRLYECLQGVDLRPDVARIQQPTLLLHGDADVIVPLAESEWLAGQIPGSRLHVVRGAGHVPTISRPREVADAINDFFGQTRTL